MSVTKMRKPKRADSKAQVNADVREQERVEAFVGGCDKIDLLIAAFLFVAVIGLMAFMAYPALHPDYWGAAAIALRTRPPESPVMGIWTLFARSVCGLLGADNGLVALKFLGWVTGGVLASMAYVLLRVLFSTHYSLMPQELSPITGRLRLLALTGAIAFACADPTWRMCQFFTDELMHVALAGLSVCSFWLYWRTGRLSLFCLTFVFSGILSAETPVGLLFSAGCFVANEVVRVKFNMMPRASANLSRTIRDRSPDVDPFDIDSEVAEEVGMTESSLENWAFCVFFFFTLISALLLDGWLFRMMGGMVVQNLGGWDYPMAFSSAWLSRIRNIISMDDFLAATAVSVLPFLLARSLMPYVTNAKNRLAFPLGWLVTFMGVVAYTQLGPWSRLWYWSWNAWRTEVPSGTVQVVLAFFGAAALTATLQVVSCACRRRFLGVDTIAVTETGFHVLLRRSGSAALAVVAVAIVILGIVGRSQPDVRRRLAVVDEYARRTVADAGDSRWIFTDGAYDDGLRVLVRQAGGVTVPVSVMSGHRPYEAYLRTSAAQDVEDVPMLEASGSEAFRFWVNEKPDHLAKTAVQVGFEVLKKSRHVHPRTAGLVMRTVRTPEDEKAFDEADRRAGDFSATALAELSRRSGLLGGFDRMVDEKIDFMLWRLARMAERRASRTSRAGDDETSVAWREQAKALDQSNRSLQVLKGKLERLKCSEGVVLTPREGLEVCLKRADFNLARHYAETVLRVDPRDPTAAFAMAMWLLENHEYVRAVKYFEISLERRPDELASLNNLALAYANQDAFDKAIEIAERAARLYPESKDVQYNLDRIRKASGRKEKNPADKSDR